MSPEKMSPKGMSPDLLLPQFPLSTTEYLISGALILVFALRMDKWLGEPARYHPLVGFGLMANRVEKFARSLSFMSERKQGILAWLLAVIPAVVLTIALTAYAIRYSFILWFVINTLILYMTIGGRSLIEHAENIYRPLSRGEMDEARFQVSMIVSRNTEKMNEKEITSSAVESVLENGNDAVFGPLIWFVLLGAPGAVLFRLANTLDAMWGYKNDRFLNFGRFSAKTDDFFGWLPARITALVYAFQGNYRSAFKCWKEQAKQCSSPNGGVVMTTGAGALGVTIGGPTYYHGVLHEKAPMGTGEYAGYQAIPKANRLVERGSFGLSYVWLMLLCLLI